jgi:hypothetical protein
LQGQDGRALESQFGLEFMGDFSDESLEWQFSDQQIGGFLIFSDFSQGDGSWSESVWLFDATGGWCAFSGGFGCQLFSWGFSSSGFSGSLFGSGHFGEMGWMFGVCFEKVF